MLHFGHQTIMAIDEKHAKNYPYKLAINDPALTSSHHLLLYLKHNLSSQRMHRNPSDQSSPPVQRKIVKKVQLAIHDIKWAKLQPFWPLPGLHISKWLPSQHTRCRLRAA